VLAVGAVQRRVRRPLYAFGGYRVQDSDVVETTDAGVLRRGGVIGSRGGGRASSRAARSGNAATTCSPPPGRLRAGHRAPGPALEGEPVSRADRDRQGVRRGDGSLQCTGASPRPHQPRRSGSLLPTGTTRARARRGAVAAQRAATTARRPERRACRTPDVAPGTTGVRTTRHDASACSPHTRRPRAPRHRRRGRIRPRRRPPRPEPGASCCHSPGDRGAAASRRRPPRPPVPIGPSAACPARFPAPRARTIPSPMRPAGVQVRATVRASAPRHPGRPVQPWRWASRPPARRAPGRRVGRQARQTRQARSGGATSVRA
jgi:hypothetical protein